MADIDTLISDMSGIRLDIACGANKQPGFIGIDILPLPGVDIVHDLNVHPWPLPDECAIMAFASHIVEHIPKVMIFFDPETRQMRTWFPFLAFMDEVWRILKPGAEFAIAAPHGYSLGYQQDPTHASALCEATWVYFDPEHPFYNFYRPRPWKVKMINWDPASNLEVVMIKRPLPEAEVGK